MEVCDSEKVPHPAIVSESGRAIVAHHSILVVEAFGAIEKDKAPIQIETTPEDPKQVSEILELQRNLSQQNRMESLHDAQQFKEQAQSMFDLGLLGLEGKAKIETVYWQIAKKVVDFCAGMKYIPDEVKELEVSLGDQYVCNFSVFQSLLDHWALGQLFPVMPIHRLNEYPERQGTLVDITCDSDGKVSKFIDLQDVKDTLSLHKLKPGEHYYLGFFLMGAYQDIMGDLHNLFGRVNEAHVFLDEDEESGWYIEETIEGSAIGEVLSLTQWDKNELARQMKSQVDAAIKSDRLKPNEAMKLLANYERALKGYTYLQFNGNGGQK
jgi:arginine decarboxylase